MPSTFSPNLRLELIGAGEQAGTWGTTTNTNLGTLVEDAISGYVAVTISSADQAFTALDGAADQARNAMVQLNSASGAFSVYAPPESKQYVLFNNTAHAATIYNSTALGNTTAAGTGVTIPAGKTLTVWSDGTNFAVQNSIFSGTVAASSDSTAVTQAFGNNTTALSTTAFVQAALQALHPVGSVYINATNSANPSTYFGFGTWVAFGAGRVPVGFNAADPLFDSAEETGGSKDATLVSHTHTATVSDPGHIHSYNVTNADGVNTRTTGRGNLAVSAANLTNAATTGISVSNSTVGSSGTNANLQPYITVFMWKRTA